MVDQEPQTILVTGGAGFIGANFVRYLLTHTLTRVVVVDKFTYAGSERTIRDLQDHERFAFHQADISDRPAMEHLFQACRPDALVNFAAETHVDRSIDDPSPFVTTNLVGTFTLLEVARHSLKLAHIENPSTFRFLHISTDEVYGSLGNTGHFTESTPYAPNSPYAASKAGADHLVQAYHVTYGLPTILTNCSNNYGPFQYPEKLIPLMILNAIDGRPLPIYGDGGNIRDWLYVEDHCTALWMVLQKGRPGSHYLIGGSNERTNREVVHQLCRILETLHPAAANPALQRQGLRSYMDLITSVTDRPGHDRRYGIEASRLQSEIGWSPSWDFDAGLRSTVQWYVANRDWCEAVLAGTYDRERLGILEKK